LEKPEDSVVLAFLSYKDIEMMVKDEDSI